MDKWIEFCTENLETLFKDELDRRTADAVLEIFRKRHDLEMFNKKALYIYIREMVDIKTPRITKVVTVLADDVFYPAYFDYLETDIIKFEIL